MAERRCSALLVGGTRNGDIVKITADRIGLPIFVPVIQQRNTFAEPDEISMGADRAIYEMFKIRLFADIFPAWFHDSLKKEDERGRALMRLLLNEQGLALLTEWT